MENISTSPDVNGLNTYSSDKKLVITYKNKISELAKAKTLELSYENPNGLGGGSMTFSKDVFDNQKTFTMQLRQSESEPDYEIENKEDIIKVNINVDGEVQNLELECK